jgi:hypothetical protein
MPLKLTITKRRTSMMEQKEREEYIKIQRLKGLVKKDELNDDEILRLKQQFMKAQKSMNRIA